MGPDQRWTYGKLAKLDDKLSKKRDSIQNAPEGSMTHSEYIPKDNWIQFKMRSISTDSNRGNTSTDSSMMQRQLISRQGQKELQNMSFLAALDGSQISVLH